VSKISTGELWSIQLSENQTFRKERDSMGEFQVPSEAYYGANTMRAVINFPISDLRFSRSFIEAISMVKLAAAETNIELGLLDSKLVSAAASLTIDIASMKEREKRRSLIGKLITALIVLAP
jgi:fumarate hydratase class II